MLFFLSNDGMRVGDTVRIKIKDICFDEGSWMIDQYSQFLVSFSKCIRTPKQMLVRSIAWVVFATHVYEEVMNDRQDNFLC